MKILERIIERINALPETKTKDRPGLIKYLKESDFAVAPASSKSYWNYPGGLIRYTTQTIRSLEALNKLNKVPYPEETITIVGLLFGIGKANFYEISPLPAWPSKLIKIEQAYKERLKGFTNDSEEYQRLESFRAMKENISMAFADQIIDKMEKDKSFIPDINKEQKNEKIMYAVRKDSKLLSRPEISLDILHKYLLLSEEESYAIRYYNSLRDDEKESIEFRLVTQRYRLVNMLIAASWDAFSKGDIR